MKNEMPQLGVPRKTSDDRVMLESREGVWVQVAADRLFYAIPHLEGNHLDGLDIPSANLSLQGSSHSDSMELVCRWQVESHFFILEIPWKVQVKKAR